jgi:signal transduction histidine kinase
MTENQLKDLQSEVTHMSRFTALGEMASTLAYEINQPLTAINNYLRGCQRLLDKIEGESSGGTICRTSCAWCSSTPRRIGPCARSSRCPLPGAIEAIRPQ